MFAPSCSPILEDQQCIDMKVFAEAIMRRRREGRMDACGSWRKSLSIMRGMMKSCMLPKPKIRGARDLGNHAIMEDELPLLPRQSLVFLIFVLN